MALWKSPLKSLKHLALWNSSLVALEGGDLPLVAQVRGGRRCGGLGGGGRVRAAFETDSFQNIIVKKYISPPRHREKGRRRRQEEGEQEGEWFCEVVNFVHEV